MDRFTARVSWLTLAGDTLAGQDTTLHDRSLAPLLLKVTLKGWVHENVDVMCYGYALLFLLNIG